MKTPHTTEGERSGSTFGFKLAPCPGKVSKAWLMIQYIMWCSNDMGVCHLASKVQAGRHLTINAGSIDEAGSMLCCRWCKLESSPYWWCFQKVMTHTV